MYDRSASPESAWTLLIKHMPAWPRTDIFLQHESDVPFGLWISWAGFLASRPTLPSPYAGDEEYLKLVDPQQVHTNKPGQYYHDAYATGPCHVVSSPDDSYRGSGPQVFQLHFRDSTDPVTVSVSATGSHGCLVPNVAYRLLGIGRRYRPWSDYWVVVEVVGERDVQGKQALEVIKWGVIHMDRDEGERFEGLGLGREDTRVVYLSSEEARARSQHVDEYMAAFDKARASGKAEHS